MPERSVRSVVDGVVRRSRNAFDALRGVAPAVTVEEPDPAPTGWWDLLPFTTHRIEVAPGIWTADSGLVALDDTRLELVLEACGGSLEGRSMVDLGCLEGGFTLAFAQRSASRSVGIEAREVSVGRCELARDLLGLDRAEFICGDIKDELAALGTFDVVFAAGILYHVGDPATMLASMRSACTSVALIDTHVAAEDAATHDCSPLVTVELAGRSYRGRMFGEYDAGLDEAGREELLWAAWSDDAAFWPLEDDLVAMIRDAGFASVEKIEVAGTQRADRWNVDQTNRVVYLARV